MTGCAYTVSNSEAKIVARCNCLALSSVTPLNCAAIRSISNLRSSGFGFCIFSSFAVNSVAAFSDSATSNAENSISLNFVVILTATVKSLAFSSDFISSNTCRRGNVSAGGSPPLNFSANRLRSNSGETQILPYLQGLRCFPFSDIF